MSDDVQAQLQKTIADLVQPGRGILAADESAPTIEKRFRAIGVESTPENRRAYRALLLGTPGLGQYLSGVILFEETLGQKDRDGTPLPELARRQGIVPGIKVDKGTVGLAHAPGDLITQGLDGLGERLKGYAAQGARFAKWREVYPISPANPTELGVAANADTLAHYAAICQEQGIVPIVEPEVLLDGDHSIERCAQVTLAVLQSLFEALYRHRVALETMVLKASMVLPGKEHAVKAGPAEVARATLAVLKRTVPPAVPSINFLSGGQTPVQATANLQAMNAQYPGAPWRLSFSYARALQQPVMDIWRGDSRKEGAAQQALALRARLNAAASVGRYEATLEPAG
jgi:fructose-bisphosphate aldolase class I